MARRLDPGPRPVRQPLPERLREAERRWRDPFVYATVRPTTQGWTVYEVSDAGVRMPTTSVERRRSYRTLDEAMAAAERRNRLLRQRDAEADAEWPFRDDPLPWECPRELFSSGRSDEAVAWHLERFAARSGHHPQGFGSAGADPSEPGPPSEE